MNDIAVRVENLGKRYRIGQIVGYQTLRESLMNVATSPFRHLRSARHELQATGPQSDYIWALKDVSFEVEHGEAVGIIGRNGSGKSTLLKILSLITSPTEGRAEIRGRVGSLLEVGTGFHPELTGRENISLNAAILGMKRAEVNRKFDEILEFSGVEKFIDTPVKRYSSGMSVRLAFAVAAHLEPEILIIDEVLAVGDAEFQKKCLGKMRAVTGEGRTVLFVSHNLSAIRELCPRSLWLDSGSIVESGASSSVVNSYLQSGRSQVSGLERVFTEDPKKDFQLLSVRLLNDEGTMTRSFECDRPVIIDLVCKVRCPLRGLYGYLSISRKDGTQVMESDSYDAAPNPLDGLAVGVYSTRVTVPPRTLAAGDYDVYFNFSSSYGRRGFNVDSPGVVCSFHLDDSVSSRGNRRGGFFSTRLPWNVTQL